MEIGTLFQTYHAELLGSMTAFCRSKSAAADAVGQAFFKACAAAAQIEAMPEGAAKAWLFAVARNSALDEFRRQKRLCGLAQELADDGEEEEWLKAEEAVRLLATLPTQDQTIVKLRYFAGYHSAEIGAMLGMAASTVRYRLARALRTMREMR